MKNVKIFIVFLFCYNLCAEEIDMPKVNINGPTKCESQQVASNFAVIYRAYLKPGKENDYQTAWHTVARYFVKYRGAIGSCLHRAPDGMWIAYSRWPDQKTRDASWPSGENAPSDELPIDIREAVITIKNSIDQERKLADICMEVINDLLLK